MHVSPSSSSEDQTLAFLLSAWSQRYWGATSPTTPQSTQPRVDQPKSNLWRSKPLKTKFKYENKQSAASLMQGGGGGGGGAGRSLGGHLYGVLLPENWRRSFVYHCFESRSKRREARRTSSERPPFWVVTETHTVRSDVEECVAEERLAWNDKNVPTWPKNISVLRTLGPLTLWRPIVRFRTIFTGGYILHVSLLKLAVVTPRLRKNRCQGVLLLGKRKNDRGRHTKVWVFDFGS